MNSIEVEVRGLLTESEFYRVEKYLKEHSRRHWEDNRETTFFLIPNTNLKVTKNISTGKAKIAYKSGSIDNTSNVEIEFPIDTYAVSKAVNLFKNLGFTKVIESNQKRTNFDYKKVEIALKHSEEWGLHFEMEVVVNSEDKIADAMNEIDSVCQELGIKYLSEKETQELARKIDAKFGKGQ